MDKKTIVVGLIALIVGAGAGTLASHRGFDEQFARDGDREGFNNTERGNGGRGGDHMGMKNADTMQNNMNTMASSLDGKTGDALDAAFLSEMTVHHQGAIDMANTLLKGSKRPELIKLANDIIAAQTKEIEQMKAWRASWFAGTSTPAQ